MNFSNTNKMYDAIVYFMIIASEHYKTNKVHISTIIESFIVIDTHVYYEYGSGVMYSNIPLIDKVHQQYYKDIVEEISKSKYNCLTIENDFITFHKDNGRGELSEYDESVIADFVKGNLNTDENKV